MAQKVLIVYHSSSGNTEKMARLIEAGLKEENLSVTLKQAAETRAQELADYDGIIMGSPTYYGTMAAELKTLLDESVALHGRLDGKTGAAFSSSANIGGGNETTVTDILNALLIHGMIIQGDPKGGHYGPVAIGAPDTRVENECRRFAKRFSLLLKKTA